MMHRYGLLMLLAVLVSSTLTYAEPVKVYLGQEGWSLNLGGEFPGAKGTLTHSKDPKQGRCVRVEYDFTGGGHYVGARWTDKAPEGSALSFDLKGFANQVRILDSTGQYLVRHFSPPTNDQWMQIEIPLNEEPFSPTRWGGANDGNIHFPIQRILIAADKRPNEPKGAFLVANLAITVPQADPETGWFIRVNPNLPGGVAFFGEKAACDVIVENRLAQSRRGVLRLIITRDTGETKELEWTLDVPGRGTAVKTVKLSSDVLGYQQLDAIFEVDTKIAAKKESGLAVVYKPQRFGQWDRDSFFAFLGASMNYAAAERIGGKGDRMHIAWGHVPRVNGKYQFHKWKGTLDHHMNVLFTIEMRPTPSWAAWKDCPYPAFRDCPSPKHLDDFSDFVQAAVKFYKGDYGAIEVNNEPDLSFWRHQSVSADVGADIYVKYLRAARKGVKAADPKALFGGPGVSGGEIEPGQFQFISRVFEKGAGLSDYSPLHPYSSPRYFGPGQFPHWPEDHGITKNVEASFDLMKKHGIPRKMWIGEFGWGLDTKVAPLSPSSLDYAACTAQGLITVKAIPGVEKCFWFCMPPYPEGNGYEYGMFRDDREVPKTAHIGPCEYPIPAANFYSTCAYLLHHSKPAGRVDIAPSIRAFRFERPEDGLTVIPLWAYKAKLRFQAKVPPETKLFNSFGRQIAQGTDVDFALNEAPMYFIAPQSKEDALVSSLKHSTIHPDLPVILVNASLRTHMRVRLELLNQTNKSLPTILTVGSQTKRLELPSGRTVMTIALDQPAKDNIPVTVQADGKKDSVTILTNLLPLAFVKSASVEKGIAETKTLPSIDVSQRGDVHPPDPNIGWHGPDDLSMKIQTGWNQKGLYLVVKVQDDIHRGLINSGPFWMHDSLQIAIDPDNDTHASAYDANDREVGLVVDGKKAAVFLSYPETRKLDCPIQARRKGNVTIYETFLPWKTLEMKPPTPGRVMAINVMANDDDGQGRSYWMGITPGIGESKNPQAYRRFVLTGRRYNKP